MLASSGKFLTWSQILPSASSAHVSSDEGDEEIPGGSRPTRDVDRMTARQRSKHDSSYVEDLMVLPEGLWPLVTVDIVHTDILPVQIIDWILYKICRS